MLNNNTKNSVLITSLVFASLGCDFRAKTPKVESIDPPQKKVLPLDDSLKQEEFDARKFARASISTEMRQLGESSDTITKALQKFDEKASQFKEQYAITAQGDSDKLFALQAAFDHVFASTMYNSKADHYSQILIPDSEGKTRLQCSSGARLFGHLVLQEHPELRDRAVLVYSEGHVAFGLQANGKIEVVEITTRGGYGYDTYEDIFSAGAEERRVTRFFDDERLRLGDKSFDPIKALLINTVKGSDKFNGIGFGFGQPHTPEGDIVREPAGRINVASRSAANHAQEVLKYYGAKIVPTENSGIWDSLPVDQFVQPKDILTGYQLRVFEFYSLNQAIVRNETARVLKGAESIIESNKPENKGVILSFNFVWPHQRESLERFDPKSESKNFSEFEAVIKLLASKGYTVVNFQSPDELKTSTTEALRFWESAYNESDRGK